MAPQPASTFTKLCRTAKKTLQKPNAYPKTTLKKPNAYPLETDSTHFLYSSYMRSGGPNVSVVPLLDQRLQHGGKVKDFVISAFIKLLRDRKLYWQALEVSEWISRKRPGKLSQAEHAIQLELIGRVRGVKTAELYFESLDNKDKVEKTYGALLSCYVIDNDVKKSLSLMKKMKQLGFASSAFPYNKIMTLYAHNRQFEKVPAVLSEMKVDGVMPDVFSYRICINSYGERGDLDSVEKILKEANCQPQATVDWLTYATVGNIFIKAAQKGKAMVYLRLSEKVDDRGMCYSHLISHHASLGNKYEVMRLWGLLKVKKPRMMDWITMLGSLIKLEEFEECEKVLKEWEASCDFYDFRVPNTLLIGYCQKGLVEKAEALLRSIIESQKKVVPTSWSIIAACYVDKQNMEKALEYLKLALAVQEKNKWWIPKPSLWSSVLSWLGDNGSVEEVEEFVRLLAVSIPKNREMYHALMKAYIRGGKPLYEVLERMKSDKIDEDEETKRIIRSKLDSFFATHMK